MKNTNPKPTRRSPNGAFSPHAARRHRGSPLIQALRASLAQRAYTADSHIAPLFDGLGMPIPAAQSVRDERLQNLLQVLGRFYVAESGILYPLLYAPRFSERTLRRDVNLLHAQKFLWMAPVSRKLVYPSVTGGKHVKVYGLTPEGRVMLEELRVVSDPLLLQQMKTADSRIQTIPKPSSLNHDLQISWWCASVVEGLRLIPWCSGIYVQVEYNTVRGQRPDALIVARFNLFAPRQNITDIPWMSLKEPMSPREMEVRWALELDNSTESLDVLKEKFETYRDFHRKGVYEKELQGDVLLAVVVQNRDRARRLALEFSHAWPDGWGLVSTSPALSGGDDLKLGPLWGDYFDMNTEAKVPLLSYLARDGAKRVYAPVMTRNMFRFYASLAKTHHVPDTLESLQDLMRERGVDV